MINLPLPTDMPFERLGLDLRTNLKEIIAAFGGRLLDEPYEATRARQAMEQSSRHESRHHAQNWAQVSDVVANAAGIEIAETPTVAPEPIPALDETREIQPLKPEYIPTPIRGQQATSIDDARARIAGLQVPTADDMMADQVYGSQEAA